MHDAADSGPGGPVTVRTPSPPLLFRREVLWLLQAALAIFVLTVVIGVLNGTDLVAFEYKALLAHVHSGTLGWLTMCLFAASLWLFSAGEPPSPKVAAAARVLSLAAVVAIPLYTGAFLFTYGIVRPILGTVVLFDIAGFFAWIAVRSRKVELSTVHLGVLAAAATSVMGGVPGVLWGYQVATGTRLLNDGAMDAHPGTMVVGFLVPVGMALAEWALFWPNPPRATRGGKFQMGLLFSGGVLLEAGLITNAPVLLVLTLPIELAALVIFQRRMWPRLHTIEKDRERFAGLSAAWTTINLGLLVYLIGRYSEGFEFVPKRELLALDHIMFIGVMTNAVFAVLDAAGDQVRRHDWADFYIMTGMNVGLGAFAVGLFVDAVELKVAFTPVIGLSILLGLATYTARLHSWPGPSAETRALPT